MFKSTHLAAGRTPSSIASPTGIPSPGSVACAGSRASRPVASAAPSLVRSEASLPCGGVCYGPRPRVRGLPPKQVRRLGSLAYKSTPFSFRFLPKSAANHCLHDGDVFPDVYLWIQVLLKDEAVPEGHH